MMIHSVPNFKRSVCDWMFPVFKTVDLSKFDKNAYLFYISKSHNWSYQHFSECQHGLNWSWGSKEQYNLWWYKLYLISKDLYVIECFQYIKTVDLSKFDKNAYLFFVSRSHNLSYMHFSEIQHGLYWSCGRTAHNGR